MRFTGIAAGGLTLALLLMPHVAVAETLEQLVQQGSAALEAKKYAEAEGIWRKVIKVSPSNAVAFSNLCDALSRQDKLDEAMEFCQKAVFLDPKLPEAHKNLGNVFRGQKKLDDALAAYRQSVQLNPKYARGWNNIGTVLTQQGKYDEAIVAYRKSIEFDAKLVNAYQGLGNVYFTLGILLFVENKPDEAIVQYRKAIELDPKSVNAYNALALALYSQKKLDEAIAQYRKVIELDPKYLDAYQGLGNALYDQKKLDEAIAQYRKGLSLPDDEKSLRLPDGTEIRTITTHTFIHNSLGRILQERGQLSEAVIEFEKATKIDPSFKFSLYNLKEARRLLALQQRPEQIVALGETRYLSSDPITRIKRSIVKVSIVFEGNAKGTAYGTGYVIKRENNKVWIITNRHVVVDKETGQQGSNLEVEPYYGNAPKELERSRLPAKIVNITSVNESLDLALLEVTGLPPDIQPLPTYKGITNPNASILIIGHPESQDWSTENGRLLNQDDDGNLVVSTKLTVGSSGSPALNSEKKVIGIIFGTSNGSQINNSGFGYAHSIDMILKQLAKWEITTP